MGQCEGNNREDEVGVLCEGEVSGGSSNVRNMTFARDDECFGDIVSLSHAREKFARVNECTVYTPRRFQGIRHVLHTSSSVRRMSLSSLLYSTCRHPHPKKQRPPHTDARKASKWWAPVHSTSIGSPAAKKSSSTSESWPGAPWSAPNSKDSASISATRFGCGKE